MPPPDSSPSNDLQDDVIGSDAEGDEVTKADNGREEERHVQTDDEHGGDEGRDQPQKVGIWIDYSQAEL